MKHLQYCKKKDCIVKVHAPYKYCLKHVSSGFGAAETMHVDTGAVREETNIGDLNSNKKGSAARKNGGKVMFHQIPMHLLAGVARVLMGGMQKYKPLNWAKGMAWSACYDCALRHMFKFWYAREELDSESMEHHLDHAICNLLFLKHYLTYYTDGDDRPEKGLFTTEDIDKLFDADEYCERNGIGPYDKGT